MAEQTSSIFEGLSVAEPIEVVEMCRRFAEDAHPDKENLSIGGYADETGKTHLFAVVRQVEAQLAEEDALSHAYLPTLGFADTNRKALGLLLGKDSKSLKSIGGTGPFRVAAELLHSSLGFDRCMYSDPTWINHRDIFSKAGFRHVDMYPYWISESMEFDFAAMMGALKAAPERTVVILHASAHNPTGMDPTRDQWRAIAQVMKERRHLPFFDCAYQGFATGDLEADAWSVRHFADEVGLEVLVSQSFGKNMGLYGERIGYLSGVVAKAGVIPALQSQLMLVVRPMYSNPAGHGAMIVGRILGDEKRFSAWASELKANVDRVKNVRVLLRQLLEKEVPQRDWSSITKQIGMFWLSGLSQSQGTALMERHHIYILPSSGRVNIGAVTDRNIHKVAKAIADVVLNVKG